MDNKMSWRTMALFYLRLFTRAWKVAIPLVWILSWLYSPGMGFIFTLWVLFYMGLLEEVDRTGGIK